MLLVLITELSHYKCSSVNFSNDPNRPDNDSVMEQFDNLTFDPSETNYFQRVIGDRFVEIDSNGKLTFYGDYPNKSKHIRVGDFSDLESYPTTSSFGFNKLNVPFGSTDILSTQIVTFDHLNQTKVHQ